MVTKVEAQVQPQIHRPVTFAGKFPNTSPSTRGQYLPPLPRQGTMVAPCHGTMQSADPTHHPPPLTSKPDTLRHSCIVGSTDQPGYPLALDAVPTDTEASFANQPLTETFDGNVEDRLCTPVLGPITCDGANPSRLIPPF